MSVQVSSDETIDTKDFTAQQLDQKMTELTQAGGNPKAPAAVFALGQALANRDFKGGNTVGGFVLSAIYSAPDDRMTADIREELFSILDLPQAKEVAPSKLDAYSKLQYPLSPGVSRSQYNTLRWVLGYTKRPPGAGSLGDLALGSDSELSGRPQFPKYTQESLVPDPTQARRHINAWHTLRSLMNQMIKSVGGVKNAATLMSNLKVSVPESVSLEIDKLIERAPPKVFGTDTENGKRILKLMYLMNGNPNNLWLGNSRINSLLPQLYSSVMDNVNAAGNIDNLVKLAQTWLADETGSSSVDEARWDAAEAVLKSWEEIKESPEVKENPGGALAFLKTRANQALTALEVDLMPGSPQEAKNIQALNKQVMISYGIKLHGETDVFDTEMVMGLFQELLTYPK